MSRRHSLSDGAFDAFLAGRCNSRVIDYMGRARGARIIGSHDVVCACVKAARSAHREYLRHLAAALAREVRP